MDYDQNNLTNVNCVYVFGQIQKWCKDFKQCFIRYKKLFTSQKDVFEKHGDYSIFLQQRHKTLEEALRGDSPETVIVRPPNNTNNSIELSALCCIEHLLSLVSPPYDDTSYLENTIEEEGARGSILYLTLKLIEYDAVYWQDRPELNIVRRVANKIGWGESLCLYLDWETACIDCNYL